MVWWTITASDGVIRDVMSGFDAAGPEAGPLVQGRTRVEYEPVVGEGNRHLADKIVKLRIDQIGYAVDLLDEIRV